MYRLRVPSITTMVPTRFVLCVPYKLGWCSNPLQNNILFLSYINSAIAYVNSTAMYGNDVSVLQTNISSLMDQFTPNTTYDAGVVAGYKAIYNTTATVILNSPIGQIELLFMNSDSNGDIGITAALQHPYSHGRIYINSSNPMDYPVIDPNYLDNPAGKSWFCYQHTSSPRLICLKDYQILLDGLKLARRVGETDPLMSNLTSETAPGSSVQTDEQWLDWLRESASSEYHPSSSCAMLPREQGGVVDANLRVYGLSNVRVADASVPPMALSTHLMASTYGLAEQASNIIRAFYDDSASSTQPDSNSTSSSSTSSTHRSSADSSNTTDSTRSNSSNCHRSPSLLHVWMPFLIIAAHVLAFNLSL